MDSFVKDLKDGKPGAFDELVLKYKNKIIVKNKIN